MEHDAPAETKKSLFKKVGKSLKKAKKSLSKSLSRKSLSRKSSSSSLYTPETPVTARAAEGARVHSEFAIRRSFSESDSRPGLDSRGSSRFLQNLSEERPLVLPARPDSSLGESSEGRPVETTGSDGWTDADTVESTLDSSQTSPESPQAKLFQSVDSEVSTPRVESATPGHLLEGRKDSAEDSLKTEEPRVVVEPIVVSDGESEDLAPSAPEVVEESVELLDSLVEAPVEVESVTPAVEVAAAAVEAQVVEVQDLVEVFKDEEKGQDDAAQDIPESSVADKTFDDEKRTEAESIPSVVREDNSANVVNPMSTKENSAPVAAVAHADDEAVVDASPAGASVEPYAGMTNQEMFTSMGKEITVGGLGSEPNAGLTNEEMFANMSTDITVGGSETEPCEGLTTEELFSSMGKEITVGGSGSEPVVKASSAENAENKAVTVDAAPAANVVDTKVDEEEQKVAAAAIGKAAEEVLVPADTSDALKVVSGVVDVVEAAVTKPDVSILSATGSKEAAIAHVSATVDELKTRDVAEDLEPGVTTSDVVTPPEQSVEKVAVVVKADAEQRAVVAVELEHNAGQMKAEGDEALGDSDDELESELDVIPEGSPLEDAVPKVEMNRTPAAPQPDGGVYMNRTPHAPQQPDGGVELNRHPLSTVATKGDVETADESEGFTVDVASKQTREFSLADVEAAKARRKSCSQVEDANAVPQADAAPARQSVDVGSVQLREGGGREAARKRWRWVRRVAAPAAAVTSALLIGISKIR